MKIICFLVFFCKTIQVTDGFTSMPNVSLNWTEKPNVLCLHCYVKNMGLGVFFYDPNGKERGHCTTAKLKSNKIGECDRGMKQRILSGEQVENILEINLTKCENGRWKCVYGRNLNKEDTVDVNMDIDIRNCLNPIKKYSFVDRCKCVLTPTLIGYFAGQVLLLFKKYQRKPSNSEEHNHVKWWQMEIGGDERWKYLVKIVFSGITIALSMLCFASIEDMCSKYVWFMIIYGFAVAAVQIFVTDICIKKIQSKCPHICCICSTGNDERDDADGLPMNQ